MKMQELKIQFKILFYITGLLCLTLGIVLTIKSDLGTSPFDALLVGLFQNFGLTIGSWEFVMGSTMVLINAVLTRQYPEYLALVTTFLTGACIDFWLYAIGNSMISDVFFYKTIYIVTGLLLGSLGISLYIQSNFALMPMDRMMLVIQELTGWSITVSRAVMSIALLIIAYLLNGPIGIGTVCSALFMGKFISFFIPYVMRAKLKFQI